MVSIKGFLARKRPAKKKVRKKTVKLNWAKDDTIQSKINNLSESLEFSHINSDRVYCYRTYGSSAKAYARIWAFPKIFQQVLSVEPAYVIEVISEKFDKLGNEEKIKVLIHELLHIPKNFSGSLLPHKYGNKQIHKEVDRIYRMIKNI